MAGYGSSAACLARRSPQGQAACAMGQPVRWPWPARSDLRAYAGALPGGAGVDLDKAVSGNRPAFRQTGLTAAPLRPVLVTTRIMTVTLRIWADP
jgi:hypothetical protein